MASGKRHRIAADKRAWVRTEPALAVAAMSASAVKVTSLGLFIIDTFEYNDEQGNKVSGPNWHSIEWCLNLSRRPIELGCR